MTPATLERARATSLLPRFMSYTSNPCYALDVHMAPISLDRAGQVKVEYYEPVLGDDALDPDVFHIWSVYGNLPEGGGRCLADCGSAADAHLVEEVLDARLASRPPAAKVLDVTAIQAVGIEALMEGAAGGVETALLGLSDRMPLVPLGPLDSDHQADRWHVCLADGNRSGFRRIAECHKKEHARLILAAFDAALIASGQKSSRDRFLEKLSKDIGTLPGCKDAWF